ncbi:cytochrome P450 [Candidatus Uabimicrobium amorphum]|uniref:Cytochrome P450 n=1 Tax=Uabimicrobium amorphum TaxID=2596890 RepID=A0A5S9ISB6_UABAM|nr:cytochrome P450 [Candidatus Uabimicrobium amorphum]BBM86631.1 cytochrome P450 [Candidatus Uabimicrobium amorphum]
METIRIAHLSKLLQGKLIAAEVEGVSLVILKNKEEISIFQGECPHQGALLSEGTIENGAIVCSGHGWRFDCSSGKRVQNSNTCLKKFTACIQDEYVTVKKDEILAWKQQIQKKEMTSSESTTQPFKKLPRPKGVPFLGNILQVDKKRIHVTLEKWADIHGSMYQFQLAHKKIVVVSDPELIGEILRKRPNTYRRLSVMESIFQDMNVRGVFSAEGDRWRKQRRVVMHALNTNHLRNFYPTLVKVTERLKKRWDHSIDSSPKKILLDLMRYTVDVTTNLAFGYDINTLEEKEEVIQQHLEKIFPAIHYRISAPIPYWRFFKLSIDHALDKALDAVRKEIKNIIAHCAQKLAQNPELMENPTNFLEAMMVAREKEDAEFTDDDIFGNVVTILLAGEDTTAGTLAWMMSYMTKYPEVQNKMQQEADAILGDAKVLQNFHDVDKLSYMEAVANETMRLKPVAPLLFMETTKNVDLGGYDIAAGTPIFLLTRHCSLQDDAFTSAREFQPQRWLTPPSSGQSHNLKAFLPFGAGPRFCPGRNLALLEIKTVMAMLCKNFSITSKETLSQNDEILSFTMMPSNLFVSFHQREQ